MGCRAFIATSSSKKSLKIGETLAYLLRDDMEAVPWKYAFGLTSAILDELIRIANEYDFGIFVFSADDIVRMKEQTFQTTRDNIIFELGLFIGTMGKERAVFIVPSDQPDFRIPSDLQGITYAVYDADAKDMTASLMPTAFQIKEHVDKLASGGELYYLYNKKSGKCLDVAGWGTNAGNPIMQWPYHGGSNQIWSLQKIEGKYFAIISKHSDKCIQVAEASEEDGARVEQGEFQNAFHQQWLFTRLPEGSYRISARHSGKCLTVESRSHENAAFIVQQGWGEDDSFKWWLGINTTID